MTKKEKEFEVQKALGLAFECDLIVTARTSQISTQKIKAAVKKHTFTSKCVREEKNFVSVYTGSFKTKLPSETKLTFDIKCVDEITGLIETELRPHLVTILVIFRPFATLNCSYK